MYNNRIFIQNAQMMLLLFLKEKDSKKDNTGGVLR